VGDGTYGEHTALDLHAHHDDARVHRVLRGWQTELDPCIHYGQHTATQVDHTAHVFRRAGHFGDLGDLQDLQYVVHIGGEELLTQSENEIGFQRSSGLHVLWC